MTKMAGRITKEHVCEGIEEAKRGGWITSLYRRHKNEWLLKSCYDIGPIHWCPFCGEKLD